MSETWHGGGDSTRVIYVCSPTIVQTIGPRGSIHSEFVQVPSLPPLARSLALSLKLLREIKVNLLDLIGVPGGVWGQKYIKDFMCLIMSFPKGRSRDLELDLYWPVSIFPCVTRNAYAWRSLSLQNVCGVIQYSPDQNKHMDTERLYRN